MSWITDKLLTLAFFCGIFVVVYLVLFYAFDVDLADRMNRSVTWSGERVMCADEGKMHYVVGENGVSKYTQEWDTVTHDDKEVGFRKDGVLVWRRFGYED